ncbi:MAG: hypothetical protein IT380_24190 [Myxococcales bacterium]|nr:hypothetical protein [Myxococcales bacterium]
MLTLTLALALHLGATEAPASAPPEASPPAAAAPARSASLTPQEERHKSFNPLIGLLEFTVGTVAAYAGVLVGVLYNIGQGGLQWPPDAGDILLLGALPAVMAAGASWLIGLMDASQRSVPGSLLHALLGAAVGQLAGLGVGYLIGRAVAGPADLSGAMAISVFVAPAFAALGAVLFMELFKPGELKVSASVSPLRDAGGLSGLAPAVAFTW